MNEEEVLMRKRLSSCSVLSESCDWTQGMCVAYRRKSDIRWCGILRFLIFEKKTGVCWEHCFVIGEGKARPDRGGKLAGSVAGGENGKEERLKEEIFRRGQLYFRLRGGEGVEDPVYGPLWNFLLECRVA